MNCAIIVTIATKLSDYIVPPIKTQFGYLFHYNKNVTSLKEGVENLKDKRVRVEGCVDVAKRSGEVIEIDVQNWLKKASEITEEVGKILENEVGEKKKCYKVWCPNFWSSYQLSKKAKKKGSTVTTLLQGGEFSKVSRPAPHPGIVSPTFTPFESRVPVMEEIMAVLKDDKIQMIGIYGIGGVGKTTIVKDIFARAKKEKLFEEVVMAVVSQTPRIKDIQGQIADLLDLKFSEETELGRAGRLRARLNDKRVLVILDDVWTSLDLSSVGIPSCNDCKGCKIMLTSRNQDVCSEMRTQKDFLINVLRDQESWTLFREIVGDFIDSPDLNPIAAEVAKECGGLPIAIITVANSLKKKSIHGWKDALQLLKASAPRNIKGMHAKVYANIELSYNSLESEEAKSCFLLCCLFPADKDVLIENLVRYAMGLRFFENVNTFEDERNRAHSLICDLKASGLLSDGKYVGHVEMHDVIRDVGLFIASKGKHIFMIKADVELKKWRPKEDTLEPYTGISLMFNDTNDLPQSLECPKLQLLSLQANHSSLGNIRIPEAFFKGMTELNVLDMSKILSPPLFGFMVNLRTLCLHRCNLGNVSILGELKSLEILSFLNSSITELPREIGQLTHLRLLDLDLCHKLKVIQPGVISSLSQLEELYMGDSPVLWEIEEHGRERSNASLVELESLSCLIILDIHIPDVKLLGKDFFFQNLIRFRLAIDSYFDAVPSYLFSATLRLKLDMGIPLGYGLQNLLRRAEDLCLDEVKGLKNVLYELDSKGFTLLKYLKVQSCNDIENIIDTSKLYKHIAFPCLEKLFVEGLPNLKSICCYGQLPAGSLGKLSVLEVSNCPVLGVVFDLTRILIEEGNSLLLSQLRELRLTQLLTLKHMWKGPTGQVSLQNLRVLVVKHCDKLEDLFSLSMVRTLAQLHLLEIDGCKMLKEIFRNEEGEGGEIINEIMLPQLNSLKLQGLPNIRSFWPLVNHLALEGNPDIFLQQSLFNRKVAFPNLEELELNFMDNLKVIWQSELPSTSFYKLRVLVVLGCHKLLAIAQTNFLPMLRNLDLLEVRCCNSLTEVFDIKEHNTDSFTSRLTELKLIDLPKLKHIWCNDFQGIPSLQNLRILEVRNCGCQNSLFSFSVGRSFVQLKEMSIINCTSLEEIIAEAKEEEVAADKIVFPQMSSLILEDLPELTSFSQKSCTFEWLSLKKMKIAGCRKLKSFTPNELDLTVSRQLFNDKVSFPGLEELNLGYMRNTMEIWDKQIPALSFSKLLELHVVCFDKLLAVVPSNLLRKVQYLETLTIENCSSLEEVFDTEGLDIGEGYAKPLSRLRDLRLRSLPRLMHLWNMDSNVYMGFQSLSFLIIYHCDCLRNIFSPYIAGTLEQLISLEIENCKMLEEIIAKGKKGEVIKIVFPKVKSLNLRKLPNLTTFCQGSYTLEWPSLESLKLQNCPQIDKFTANKMGMTNGGLESDLDIQIQHLFDEKIAFPCLMELELSSAVKLSEIWHGQLPVGSFNKLYNLKVEDCHQLMSIVPSNLLPRLQNLKILNVVKCSSLVKVFDVKGLNVVEGCAELSQLGELTLQYLPKLMHICDEVPAGFQGFRNLCSLNVKNCDSLRYLFSASVAKYLVLLQTLTVCKCKLIEEIVAEEEVIDKIEFPSLEILVLEDLPNFMSFCLGNCTFEWASLRVLSINNCPQLKSFPSRSQSTHAESVETLCETDIDAPLQHLFDEKVSFPSLKELTLSSVNLNDICYGLPSLSLCQLRILEVENCDKLLSVVTSNMLQRLHALEDLTVRCCGSLVKVFDLEGIVFEDGHAVLPSMLKKLMLKNLPALLHVLKKGPREPVFQNLELLLVHDCDSLKFLFSVSISRGLTRLQKLDVRRCKMIEEIIAEEEGEVIMDKIGFPKLKSMTLKSLPNLIIFCPGNYTFEWPSLNAVHVHKCPKMKTSISGFEETQKLKRTQVGRDNWVWRSENSNTLEFISFKEQRPVMDMEIFESDTDNALAGAAMDCLGKRRNQEKGASTAASAAGGGGGREGPPQDVPLGTQSSSPKGRRVTAAEKGKGIAPSQDSKRSKHIGGKSARRTTISIQELAIPKDDGSASSDEEADISAQLEAVTRAKHGEGTSK